MVKQKKDRKKRPLTNWMHTHKWKTEWNWSFRSWPQLGGGESSPCYASQSHNLWCIQAVLYMAEQPTLFLLFKPVIEWTFVCALLLSEMWYIATFNTWMVHFITPTVSTTQSDATSGSWHAVSSCYLPSSSVAESDELWSAAWWQFRQRQPHTCTYAMA